MIGSAIYEYKKKSMEEDQHSRNMVNLVHSRGYLRGSYLELKGGSKGTCREFVEHDWKLSSYGKG